MSKIVEDAQEAPGVDDIKEEMQVRIEEGRNKLMKNITILRQKEKEDKIQGHQKIIEGVELQLENVKFKYDGIISKVGNIEDQAQRIEDAIVLEKQMDDLGVYNEGKPSKEKPYRHLITKKVFKKDKVDINITKEDGIINSIHGTRHHKTII